jgi:hypothetical protein
MEKKVHQKGNVITDTSYITQPEKSLSFALNAVNETVEGDLFLRSYEESNEQWYELLSENTIILGNCSISNGDRVLMLLDKGNSYIALLNSNNSLSVIFSDEDQTEKMNFKANKQIQVIFRLRRGCERTIYWVDPKPRVFSIDRPDKHKLENGDWNIASFDLIKKPNSIPKFQNIQVLSSGGFLKPGSYNIQVQLLDGDFNATEFVDSSEVIHIFNDNLNSPFSSIRGSSNVETSYYNPQETSKAIQVTLSNLDLNFPFYRLAFSEATSGSGLVSSTKYSEVISTSLNTFIYTGINFVSEGNQEDIVLPATIITEAGHIEQIDNMLILGETKGEQVNYCLFQKYASQIATDCVTKTVLLSQTVGANGKNPLAKIQGLGYMPKEIYALAINYILEGNIVTPAYHIPGKSPEALPFQTYTLDSYPMRKDNISESNFYIDNSSCEDSNFWGKDFEGNDLKNTLVRHHRFPSRSEIGLPLIEEITQDNQNFENLITVRITISGELEIPEDCPPDDLECQETPIEELEDILYEITYEDGEGNVLTYMGNINYDTWSNDDPQVEELPGLPTDIITVLSFTEYYREEVNELENGGVSPSTGLTYNYDIVPYSFTSETKQYKTEVLGLKFSNIILPTPEELGGKKVIGYFFSRAIRNQEDKTILDSAVLTSTMQHQKFVSHGLLFPALDNSQDVRINRKNFSLICPEHKFNNTQYSDISRLYKEGEYNVTEVNESRFKVQDVFDGTSYNSKRHRRSERDNDGWDLHIKSRDSVLQFETTSGSNLINQNEIEEIFYLNPLESKNIEGQNKEFFNLSADNKIGVVNLKNDRQFNIINSAPYVLIEKDNSNPYSNFRSLPYIRISKDIYFIEGTQEESHIAFGGDVYISSMKYVSSVFLEDRARKRRGKRGGFLITAGLIALAGAILIFSMGTAAPLSLAIAATAIAALGTTFAIAGIDQASYNKAYKNLYNRGLRKTILDNTLNNWMTINPNDDELRWFCDVSEFWFESQVNIGLRYGSNIGTITDFINSPAVTESGNDSITDLYTDKKPVTKIDEYLLLKFTYLDFERKIDNRGYYGYPQPELYLINKDYNRNNLQKTYLMLSLEYDCCSDCVEIFPHRIYNSEQSFEEELSDNYRIFLPNNYRDIEGGTGKITNIFKLSNNLYIHTQHALWHQPQNFQERVTGDIVSFIGTGSYFATPPRPIVDDKNNSAGTEHKWGAIKTPYGVLFPCEVENKWYFFNGQKLEAISNEGNANWFRKNMPLLLDKQYNLANNKIYPFRNNPVNEIGSGYVSAFDSSKDRLIVTKKDMQISNLPESDYEICNEGNGTIIFENFSQIVAEKEEEGYTYVGLENCNLKFVRESYTQVVRNVNTLQEVLNESYIVVGLDYSGSFTREKLLSLATELQTWYNSLNLEDTPGEIVQGPGVMPSLSSTSEKLVFIPKLARITGEAEPLLDLPPFNAVPVADVDTERFLLGPSHLIRVVNGWNDRPDFNNEKVVYLSFVNESEPDYCGPISVPLGTVEPKLISGYYRLLEDYQDFKRVRPFFSSFIGICYPVVFPNIAGAGASLLRTLLAIYKNDFEPEDFTDSTRPDYVSPNSLISVSTYQNIANSVLYDNPYFLTSPTFPNAPIQEPLQDLNWLIKTDRNSSTDVPITSQQFGEDIENLLQNITLEASEENLTTFEPIFEVSYVEGQTFQPEILNNGWTWSYSLKEKGWVSLHSYIPSYYITDTERFYSWYLGLTHIYKHNKLGSHGFFYENKKPFILEFVINEQAVLTKIQDYLEFQSSCQVYDTENEMYVDVDNETFNKLLVYNSYQISSLLNLVQKTNAVNYLNQQVVNPGSQNIVLDRHEKNWTVNNLRDWRANNNQPLFTKSLSNLQENYYIDKVVNPLAVNYEKEWFELESFRDKFLVVRLIYDNFADVKLTMEFSISDSKISER